jgi:hypothetical protein
VLSKNYTQLAPANETLTMHKGTGVGGVIGGSIGGLLGGTVNGLLGGLLGGILRETDITVEEGSPDVVEYSN